MENSELTIYLERSSNVIQLLYCTLPLQYSAMNLATTANILKNNISTDFYRQFQLLFKVHFYINLFMIIFYRGFYIFCVSLFV
jgi:hypothetical protein